MSANKCWFSFMPVADAILLTNHHAEFKYKELDLKQAQRQGWKCMHCKTVINNLNKTAYVPYIITDNSGRRAMAGYISCLPCNEQRKAANKASSVTASPRSGQAAGEPTGRGARSKKPKNQSF